VCFKENNKNKIEIFERKILSQIFDPKIIWKTSNTSAEPNQSKCFNGQ